MTTVINLRDAAGYYDPKGPLAAQLRAAALKGLYAAALRAKRDIVSKVIPDKMPKPVDRGIYRAGWQVEKLRNGAAIYNPVPHAAMIEFGVPAANVVISNKAQMALAEWVQRKLGGKRGRMDTGAMQKASQGVNAARAKFNRAKATYRERAERARAAGRPIPAPPRPPGILTSRNRIKHDFGYAWQLAGAILHALKKRGIFARGKGLRVMEGYVRNTMPAVIREEVAREIAKVAKG